MNTSDISIPMETTNNFAEMVAKKAAEIVINELRNTKILLTENEAAKYRRYLSKDEKLYSLEEAAQIIGISTTTLIKYRKSGLIDYTWKGKTPKYSQSNIDRFLKNRN